MWRSKLGFTLIELLVTVGLIAIMSGAAISVMGPSSRRYGRDSRRQSDLQSISSAMEIYRTDNGTYPATTGWQSALTSGNYVRTVPGDPQVGNVYAYTAYYFNVQSTPVECQVATTRCPGYSLCSTLERSTTPVPNDYPACPAGATGCGTTACRFRVTNP